VAEAVYLLCALTSIVCAVLLFRGYRVSQTRLLFWSSISFAGLALHNTVLVVDLVLLPDIDLFYWRAAIALVSMFVLLYGLIWETR